MRRILLFAAVLFAAFQLSAAPVDWRAAQAKAQSFVNEHLYDGRLRSPISGEMKLAHTEMNSKAVNRPVYYIFNSSNGYVIVSADDRAEVVLGYGDYPLDINNIPCNMRAWLATFREQIEYLQAHEGLQVETPSMLKASFNTPSVAPLLTALWDQEAPYWNQCVINGYQCLTGCPATSLAMVFHYWKYPRQQTPAVPSYTMSQYGVVLPELQPTVFDWDNMLDEYKNGYNDVQAAAVAHLMRYIGQAEEMDYTISGSGAYGKDVLRAVKFFEYDQNAQLLFKTDDLGYANYTDAQWGNMIQAELEAGRPIVYLAYDNYTGAGHAFNVDGYDGNGGYHINWGWNGRGNGHYALNAFSYDAYTFGTGQQMVIGIQPSEGYQNPRLQAYPATVDMECYINRTATAIISLKGTNLTGDVTLTLNDANGVFAIDAATLSQAVAEAGRDITVTYAPRAVGSSTATITCTSPDCAPLTITLNGNGKATLSDFKKNGSEIEAKPVAANFGKEAKTPLGRITINKTPHFKEAANDGMTIYLNRSRLMDATGTYSGKLAVTRNDDNSTVLNLTNHTFFNLSGNPSTTILDHQLQIDSKYIATYDKKKNVDGKFMRIKNTPFDFTSMKAVGTDINIYDEQMSITKGYDHAFLLKHPGKTNVAAAKVYDEKSGRMLTVYTTEPALQIYTANGLDGTLVGKKGVTYNKQSAICMETMHFSDSPNQTNFPSTVLRPGETYRSQTTFQFSDKPAQREHNLMKSILLYSGAASLTGLGIVGIVSLIK